WEAATSFSLRVPLRDTVATDVSRVLLGTPVAAAGRPSTVDMSGPLRLDEQREGTCEPLRVRGQPGHQPEGVDGLPNGHAGPGGYSAAAVPRRLDQRGHGRSVEHVDEPVALIQ